MDAEKPALEHTTARSLTRAEIDAFLARTLIARMATYGGGRPHVVPVWYEWDRGALWITIDAGSRKYRNLSEHPYCAVSIDESLGGLRFIAVILEGPVELITEPREWVLERVRAIYTRYLGREGVLAPTPQRMLEEGDHVVVKLLPERTITWCDTDAVAPVG